MGSTFCFYFLSSIASITQPKDHTIQDDSTFTPLMCLDNDGRYDELYDPDRNYEVLKNAKVSCEYYSQDQFSDQVQDGTFSSLHVSIRSLPKNHHHLSAYLSTLKHYFSVMAILL